MFMGIWVSSDTNLPDLAGENPFCPCTIGGSLHLCLCESPVFKAFHVRGHGEVVQVGVALPCLPALRCAPCVAQMNAAPLPAPAMLSLFQQRPSFHPCKQGSRGFWARALLLGSEGLVTAQLLPPYLLGVPRAVPAGGAGKATGDGHGKDQSTCWEKRNPGGTSYSSLKAGLLTQHLCYLFLFHLLC